MAMARRITVLFVMLCGVVSAEEQKKEEPWLEGIVKVCHESAATKRSQLESQLAYLKKVKGKGTFKNASEKKRAIEAIEANLKKQDADLIAFDDLDTGQFKVGATGCFWLKKVPIVQVINSGAAIVDSKGGIVTNDKTPLVWLETDTTGWTNGITVDFSLPIVITGTKTYDTQNGSNTIFLARAMTPEVLKKVRSRLSDTMTR